MKKFLNATLLLAFIATFTGCVKDNGPSGNADLASFNYSVRANQWLADGTRGTVGFQYYSRFDVPEITQSVMDFGTVMVYKQENSLFYPLPVSTSDVGYVSTIQYNVYLGMVEIFIEDTDFLTDPPADMNFKVVVFNQLKSLPVSLDIKNYKQVEAYMGK